jgi:hypothetical protein
MDPERWKRIDALLSAALDREEAERASFLAQACEGDEELRRQIQSLLLEQKAAGSFLQTPLDPAEVMGAAQPALSENELGGRGASPGDQTLPLLGGMGALPHGSLLGRYIVLNKIGSGGMGVVYWTGRWL